jgi:mRNA interferase MazF
VTRRPVQIGDVLLVQLPQHVPPGHEQIGTRPAVVVGIPDRLGQQRYPTWIVVPLTTQAAAWAQRSPALYPAYPAGVGGLVLDSVALLDNVRSVDLRRILKPLGMLTKEQYEPIREGLERMSQL